MRILALLLVLCTGCSTQTFTGSGTFGLGYNNVFTAGCGSYLTNGADNSTLTKYDQSTCDPIVSTGKIDHTGWTSLSACPASGALSTSTNYYLTQNIGDAVGQLGNCIAPANNSTLDLNGHTLYGFVYTNGTVSGWTMENGFHTCALPTTAGNAGYPNTTNNGVTWFPIGCYTLTNSGCPAVSNLLQDIQWQNTSVEGGSPRNVRLDRTGAQTTQCAQYVMEVFRSKSISAQSVAAARVYNFDVEGSGNWYIHQSHCQPNAISTGTQCFGGASNTAWFKVWNNYLDLALTDVTATDDARGVLLDGVHPWDNSGGSSGSHDADIQYNYCKCNNNRFGRIRDTETGTNLMEHNYVDTLVAANGFTGIFLHGGVPDVGDDDWAGSWHIKWNKVILGPSTYVYQFGQIYDSVGMDITSNYINCDAGGCAGAYIGALSQASTAGARTEVYVHDDVIDGNIPGTTANLFGGGTGAVLWTVATRPTTTYAITNSLRKTNSAVLKISGTADAFGDPSQNGHNMEPGGTPNFPSGAIVVNGTAGGFDGTALSITRQFNTKATVTLNAPSGGALNGCASFVSNSVQYATVPAVTVTGGGGTGGTVTLTTDATGVVNGCSATGGTGYTTTATGTVAYSHALIYANTGVDSGSGTNTGTVAFTDQIIFKGCQGSSQILAGTTGAGATPTRSACP